MTFPILDHLQMRSVLSDPFHTAGYTRSPDCLDSCSISVMHTQMAFDFHRAKMSSLAPGGRCHISRLPRLGSLFLRASLCRRQAWREATISKLPSIPNETGHLAHCLNNIGVIVCMTSIAHPVLVLRATYLAFQ
jgi:hypothetical protein